MENIKFYVCPVCKSITSGCSDGVSVSCCGNEVKALVPDSEFNENHKPSVEYIEDDIFVSINHPMDKEHYISFISYVTAGNISTTRLYPEQNAEARFKRSGHGTIYFYCNNHGLFMIKI